MENIQTLLAAVAQTQGFEDDDDPLDVNSPQLGFQTSASSPMTPVEMSAPPLTVDSLESDEWSSEVSPSEVYPLPLASIRTIGAGDKRKRGRPAKGQVLTKLPPLPKRKKLEDEDEDVCFICFDGGSLVLCDKKGCPKAYHPACIKRDEAFFKTKAKWNCGWHICSVCRRNSHYMCYTCTYSLCRGCTKDADYVSVRGDKGFCSTCMKTIMLLENKDQANTEAVKVDFDDKLSWEYLFKVYWVYLKEKLLLTLSELIDAKSPWKGVSPLACKQEPTHEHNNAIDMKPSISLVNPQHLELNTPFEEISIPHTNRLKVEASVIDNHVETQTGSEKENAPSNKKEAEKSSMDRFTAHPVTVNGTDESVIAKATEIPGIKEGISTVIVEDTKKPCICKQRDEPSDRNEENSQVLNNSEWASKDLLEFVVHMKNGDTSALSQFEVQKLLIDYIKRNKLRDPQQKSQIICDSRLTNLFGKARVGHIEMLKLLEFHFPVKEDVEKNSFIPAGLVGSSAIDMEIDGNSQAMPVTSRKRKRRKKTEEKAPDNNLTEYAAIDFHNINLIFLRRNLMETLVEDKEKFNDKVLGSIVRIRISSNDQKPDVYRLVQVVGTSKVREPYKIGDKIADIVLEVLNLDKKEAVSIDSISDQEFTEDECGRLRQSIRCGLMKQFTVGELQTKAMALQPVRLNGWLEAEILRLNHLRDRASEKGHKKELRECVHKLQLLKSPEERKRRISRIPEVHADPKMSPTYESEEDSRTVINSKYIPDSRSVDNSKKDGHRKTISSEFAQSGRKSNSPNKKGKQDAPIPTQVRVANSAIGGGNDQARQRSGPETSVTAPRLSNLPSDNIETEKLWHYRDPNGKIQGPFAIMQLRKWNTTGLFPLDMRIWTNHEQFDSLLLTAVLNGKYHGVSEQARNSSPDTLKTTHVVGKSQVVNGIGRGSRQKVAASSKVEQKVAAVSSEVERKVAASSNHGVKRKVAAASNHGVEQKVAAASNLTVEQKVAAVPNHTVEQRVAAAPNHTVEQNVARSSDPGIDLSDHAAGQKESASSIHGIGLSNHVVEQKEEASYHAVEQKEETSSDHGIGLSNHSMAQKEEASYHAVEQKEEASSNNGFDLSNPAIEHKEAALSNHGFDLSKPAIEQKEASSNHEIDLSEPAIEQKDTSSNHGIDLSEPGVEQSEATSSSHAVDLSNHAVEQKEAVLSSHEVDLSRRAVEQVETASSNHRIVLSNHAEEAVSPSHGVDLSKRAVEQVETASSYHRIDLFSHAVEQKEEASSNHGNDLSDYAIEQAEVASSNQAMDLSIPAIEQKEEASSNQAIESTNGNGRAARTDESGSSSWPLCWDILKDDNSRVEDVQEHIVPPPSGMAQPCESLPDRSPEMNEFNHVTQIGDINSSVQALTEIIFGDELQDQSDSQGQTVPSSTEHPFHIDLMSSNDIKFDHVFTPTVDAIKQEKHIGLSDLNENLAEKQQSLSSSVPLQTTGILELLSPTPRSNVEDQGVVANGGKQPGLIDLSLPVCGPSWTSLLMGDDWSGFPPTPEKAPVNEWDPGLLASSSMRPHEVTNENIATTSTSNHNNPFSHHTSWLAMLNEPIEFDALGEESVSDLLAEVDAMESQHGGGGGFPSPTSAMKFAKELLLDCKDDCFSSIEEFSSTHDPGRSDAFSATDNNHNHNNNSVDLNPPIDALDSFRRSAVHSSASSEGETNNPQVYSSREGGSQDFHHSAQNNMIMQDIFGTPPGSSESMDPGWGGVQGNINLVTVQGNVNLVLGGHGQGMANLNWAPNQGNPWVNPILNPSPRNGTSLPWEQPQQQRKYGGGGERFVSPRDWNNNNNYQGGSDSFGRGRPPWGRQVYGNGGGGGYSRPIPKGQRVCKFYESGRCKKGAFCDYLHP